MAKKTAIDFFGALTDPNIPPSKKQMEHLKTDENSRILFCKKNKCWKIENDVTGEIVDGWFIPNKGQVITYKIKI